MFALVVLSNLIIPVIMFIAGLALFKYPPHEVNSLVGYRTRMSMKNKDTWEYANKLCGKIWMRLGAVMIPISLIAVLFFKNAEEDVLSKFMTAMELIQLALLLGTIPIVEKALRNTFDKNGLRKK